MEYGWNVENELTFGDLSRDFYYTNLLVDNIMAENLTEVRDLLENKKANPNIVMPELGVAPLHLLAGLENEDFSSTVTLQAVLRNGGDPNVRSEDGLTPVHVAAMWGRCKVLDILLSNGGDPELIDYKFYLNAEEYSIKEQQWKAYGVLCTFYVMAEGENKVNERYEKKSCGSEISSEFSNFSMKEIKNKLLLKLKDKSTNYSDNSSIKGSQNSCRYATVRKKKTKKKNHTDDESRSDQSDESKNTIKLLNLNSTSSTIKRQSTGRKYKKNNMPKNIQTGVESQSYWSKNTAKSLKPEEGKQSTIKRQTNTVKKNNKIGKNNQTNNESHSDQSDWSKSTIQAMQLNYGALHSIKRQRRKTNIYESPGTTSDKSFPRNNLAGNEPKEKSNKLTLYGDSVSESCDWIRKSVSSIKLDKNALNTIKNQRLRSKIYQTKGVGEDPMKAREKKPPLYEESETCDWVDPGNPATFDEPSQNKINIHRARTMTYTSEGPEDSTMQRSGPKLPRRNRKTHHKKNEDSEMYLCGFTESSIRTDERQRRSHYLSSGLSDVTSSDFDGRGIPNQRVLCKMSRIFLFMLKKRHIYQKIK